MYQKSEMEPRYLSKPKAGMEEFICSCVNIVAVREARSSIQSSVQTNGERDALTKHALGMNHDGIL